MSIKPAEPYIHEEIAYINADLQSTKVTERVCSLIAQGYKVKVIEHSPQFDPLINRTEFLTTIMATLTDLVDISN